MSILTECMIVNVYVSRWSGFRLDRDASADVNQRAHAEAGTARVNKRLVAKELMKPIDHAESAIRQHVTKNTLPWKDNGDRLLVRKLYQEFMVEYDALKENFDREVDKFLNDVYPVVREQAGFRMGDLFKSDDYPTASELRHKFHVQIDIDPVQDLGDDFRVQMEQRMTRAIMGVWDKLADRVSKLSEALKSDKKFRNTTVTYVRDLVELLPELNVTNDPNLARIGKDIANSLAVYEPDDLRQDAETRAFAASEADRIMSDMRGFMTAAGGAI